jgi:hypothetical protein
LCWTIVMMSRCATSQAIVPSVEPPSTTFRCEPPHDGGADHAAMTGDEHPPAAQLEGNGRLHGRSSITVAFFEGF